MGRRQCLREGSFSGIGQHLRATIGLAILLMGLGNGLSAILQRLGDEATGILLPVKLALLVALLWVTLRLGLSLWDVGLKDRRWLQNLSVGIGGGLLMILPVAVYFLFPVGVPGGEIAYEEAEERDVAHFLVWALLYQPLGTSLFEEALFRGALQALALKAMSPRKGIALVALTFGAWHLVVNYHTVKQTSVGEEPVLFLLAQIGAFLGLIVGSLVLSYLRLRTGSLAAPIGFHWAVVVTMQGTLTFIVK